MARLLVSLVVPLVAFVCAEPARAAPAPDCPNGGTVRFAVEPYEAAARLLPAFDALTKAIGEKLGCAIELSIPTSYNAEIEAMRAGKLDVGEFGPLGYVLAHKIAAADSIATYGTAGGKPIAYFASIVTWPGSGIGALKDVAHHSFAYSDAASTSGHLFPAYGLAKNGVDPDRGVDAIYAGSHTASFEAIRNHKVDAGELNSVERDAAAAAGEYDPAKFVTLWTSQAIPNDAIALRRDLPASFKKRLTDVVLGFPFARLPPDVINVFPAKHPQAFVPMPDAAYDVVRDLVKTLHIDLNALS